MGKSNGNADNDTTETLNIAEAEEMNGKHITKPHIDKKGKSLNFLHEDRLLVDILFIALKIWSSYQVWKVFK